jgi:predicted RNA-binding Zn-ribbon protein involved in translation (DUF1610 family)
MALVELNPSRYQSEMALIKCPECGEALTDRALPCPKCGAVILRTGRVFGFDPRRGLKWVLWIFILFVLWFLVFAQLGKFR